MASTLYLAVSGADSGKSAVALGVLTAMRRRAGRVGVFRPVVRGDAVDPVLRLLGADVEDHGITYDQLHADPDGAVPTVVERYRARAAGYDAMVVVGTDYTDVGASTELSFNARVAVELACPVLLVVSGHGRSPAETLDAAAVAQRSLRAWSCPVIGVVVNRAGDPAAVRLAFRAREGQSLVGVLPEEPGLSRPTLRQLFAATDARLIVGGGRGPEPLDAEVPSSTVCAMTLPHALENLNDADLVITPGDRADVIVGTVLAHRAQTFPRLSGLLLTGGQHPDPPVRRLLDGLNSPLPIAVTTLNTFAAASVAARTRGALTDLAALSPGSGKTPLALALAAEHLDLDGLLDRLDLHRSTVLTPLMFAHDLAVRARGQRRRIVLPEGTEARVLRAAAEVLADGVADIVLLGDPAEVSGAAVAAGADISRAVIRDPHEPELRTALAQELVRRRAHKNLPFDAAWDLVCDVSYCGTLMVVLGLADGMVSGAVNTTAHTIRPAMQVMGTVPGVSVISSVFFMCLPDRVLVYGDCAVNPNPDAAALADIAISSARTAAEFGVDPRVAMLSYSTGASGSGADVDQVRAAVALVRARAPELPVEGPIQYDAAVDAGVARTKLPGSSVAGQATVFVFPDLNTGNNTYKAVQRSAGAVAVGPVLQGLAKPVNDLSRGATVADIVTTIAITAVQAQGPGAQTGPGVS